MGFTEERKNIVSLLPNNYSQLKFKIMPLDVVSTTEEKVHIHIAPKTSSGKPAAIEAGSAVWTLDGTGSIVPDADGLGAYVISADAPGVSNWSVSADADLGSGVATITDGGVYTYNDPLAAALGATADAPEAK